MPKAYVQHGLASVRVFFACARANHCVTHCVVFADDVRLIGFTPQSFSGDPTVMRIFRDALLAVLQNEIATRYVIRIFSRRTARWQSLTAKGGFIGSNKQQAANTKHQTETAAVVAVASVATLTRTHCFAHTHAHAHALLRTHTRPATASPTSRS